MTNDDVTCGVRAWPDGPSCDRDLGHAKAHGCSELKHVEWTYTACWTLYVDALSPVRCLHPIDTCHLHAAVAVR